MSVLSPPICLNISLSYIGPDTTYSPLTNFYNCTLTILSNQSYSSSRVYNGSSITTNMWLTTSLNGSVFRIKRIDSQSPTSVTCSVEDVDNFNKLINVNLVGGKPLNGNGYLFELNPTTGLPVLTNIFNSPTLTFPDSIVGRFLFSQTGSAGSGNYGYISTVINSDSRFNTSLSLTTTNFNSSIGTWDSMPTNKIQTTLRFNSSNYPQNKIPLFSGGTYNYIDDTFKKDEFTYLKQPSYLTKESSSIASPFSLGNLYDIAYGNNKFVIVGVNDDTTHRTYNSADGITWTQRLSGLGGGILRGVTYGNNSFVAVGNDRSQPNNRTIYTSSNGDSWQLISTGGAGTYRGIAYGNGIFIAVGNDGSNFPVVTISTDLSVWNDQQIFSYQGYMNSVAYVNGLFIAVGTKTDVNPAGTQYLIYSTNGIGWLQSANGLGEGSLTSVTYGNGLYVVVGGDDNGNKVIYTSPDAINWKARLNGLGTGTLNKVIYSNGIFIAVGNDSSSNQQIYISRDTITWTFKNIVESGQLNSIIAYSNSKIIAIGNNGPNQQIYNLNNEKCSNKLVWNGTNWVLTYTNINLESIESIGTNPNGPNFYLYINMFN